jgi:hypothetical protein
MAQVLPDKNCYILFDNNLNAIISVFSTLELCENAMRQLIKDDCERIRRIINDKIISLKRKDGDLGILQIINYILEKPKQRLLDMHFEYEGYSPKQNYRYYIKELNDFDMTYKNNSRIIVLPVKNNNVV